MKPEEQKEAVRERYAGIARQVRETDTGCGCGCGCGSGAEVDVGMRMVDYAGADGGVVEGANLGLGCGVPTLYAGIRAGDVVVDLGSGAGVDAFLAAEAVGPSGRVIGIDMTKEMIVLARTNALKGSYSNVTFRLGEIEALPLEDASADVVISNCVINLVPDKERVFREVFRVLRPGGRFCISDVVSWGGLPEEVQRDVGAVTGCIGGALDQEAYLGLVARVGFTDLRVDRRQDYDLFTGEPYGVRSITLTGVRP